MERKIWEVKLRIVTRDVELKESPWVEATSIEYAVSKAMRWAKSMAPRRHTGIVVAGKFRVLIDSAKRIGTIDA